MHTWPAPALPALGGTPPPLSLTDSADGFRTIHDGDSLRLWVCGITPYDATHLGHAKTYVAFDTLARTWLDGGRSLTYAQNLTDIDDPLFERAEATNVVWHELAAEQTDLFRSDMEALRVLPPDSWTSISEKLDDLEAAVRRLEESGTAYRLANEDGTEDVYADLSRDPEFATAPCFAPLDLAAEFDDKGGDSERPGKRTALDPIIWKGVRGDDFRPADGKPGSWRPGWHIECALIALDEMGGIDVQGGGSDLLFPHHEMSEAHLREFGVDEPVRTHFHSGMVAFDGTKMSKSLGNLVLVSRLLADGIDARAIRLAILANHPRSDWEYTDDVLHAAQARLDRWGSALNAPVNGNRMAPSAPYILERVRAALADDLDTPAALAAVDQILPEVFGLESDREEVRAIIDALLGVAL